MYEKQNAGTLAQTGASVEIAAKSAQQGIWEQSVNTFSTVNLTKFLVSFNMGANALLENGNNIV
jgi:hypothetical protein